MEAREMRNFCFTLIGICILALAMTSAAQCQTAFVPWTTRSADNARSGWNGHETQLRADLIRRKGVVRIGTWTLPGDARGLEAQPLILPNVRTASGPRDVMVLASMANVVRAVDARDGSSLWQVELGKPVAGSKDIDMHLVNDHWGCLSTGVIDPDSQRLYQVCWISNDGTGSPKTARWYMFVLNLADGSQATPPVLIEGISEGQDFATEMRKQRSSLVETDVDGVKTIFGCAGTIYEVAEGASGFCFAFDVAANRMAAMLAMTAGHGAGVWMAGQGIVADPHGDLYVMTGNGDFDGKSQWAESLLKLKYVPPSQGRPATLSVVDHWTPWTDHDRIADFAPEAEAMAGMSAVTEAVKRPSGAMQMALASSRVVASKNGRGQPIMLVYLADPGKWSDQDLGSAGPACLFAIGLCVATGKDGIAYPIKTDDLGGTTLSDLQDPKANCAKLAAPPVWLTVDPGPVDPCPAKASDLNFLVDSYTAHLHMTPVQFFDPVLQSWTIFAWGENGHLRKWAASKSGALTFVAEGREFASADARAKPPGGMTGGFCAGASDGADPNSAFLVCAIPYGDANAQPVNGRLLIYDPVHVTAAGELQVLWDSQQWGLPFVFNKFDPPVIDGGQIYVPNYSGGVDVYRLTP
jgi:hypothetical protein